MYLETTDGYELYRSFRAASATDLRPELHLCAYSDVEEA